jgi:hypothetical protein
MTSIVADFSSLAVGRKVEGGVREWRASVESLVNGVIFPEIVDFRKSCHNILKQRRKGCGEERGGRGVGEKGEVECGGERSLA